MTQPGPPRVEIQTQAAWLQIPLFTPSFFIKETLELGLQALPSFFSLLPLTPNRTSSGNIRAGGAGKGQEAAWLALTFCKWFWRHMGQGRQRGVGGETPPPPHSLPLYPRVTELTWTGSSSFQGGLIQATKEKHLDPGFWGAMKKKTRHERQGPLTSRREQCAVCQLS